jgi:hypothetical protein
MSNQIKCKVDAFPTKKQMRLFVSYTILPKISCVIETDTNSFLS